MNGENPATAPKGKLAWGFVGTSGWVRTHFAPSVIEAGHQIRGAVGSSQDGSARFAGEFGCSTYSSLAELVNDPQVDAIWVASPPYLHVTHALVAVDAGKPTLIEKPLGMSLSESRKLLAQCVQTGVLTAMAYQQRHNPGVGALRELIVRGDLGRVCAVTIHRSSIGPSGPAGWRRDETLSGGWTLPDVGSHLIDLARYLLPGAQFHSARLSSPGTGQPLEDLACVLLTAGDATAFVRSSAAMSPASYIEVYGTKGAASLVDFWSGGGRLTSTVTSDQTIAACNLYARQAQAFAKAVDGRGWSGASLEDGLHGAEILLAARHESLARPVTHERGSD